MPNEAFTEEEHAESRALMAKAPAPINVFAQGQSSAVAANATAGSDQARAIAETQAAMVIAKRFPRDQMAAMDRILQAFSRPTLAEAAQYSYSRGGTDITGPSIRSAEAIAQLWGNLQYGVRELEQRGGESTVEAFAWDVETNTRQVKVFQVPHIRYTRQGSKRLEDPRDIYELIANQGARRLRACILGVVPGDVVEAAMNQADVTLKTKVEVTPELLQSLLDKFASYGVTKEHIEKRIQRHLDSITPALVVSLGKIFNSLKDGMSAPSDWFEVQAAPLPGARDGETDKSASSRLKAAAAAKVGEKKDAGGGMTFAQVADAIGKAATDDDLAMARDLIRSVGDPGHRAELEKAASDRAKAIAS